LNTELPEVQSCVHVHWKTQIYLKTSMETATTTTTSFVVRNILDPGVSLQILTNISTCVQIKLGSPHFHDQSMLLAEYVVRLSNLLL
jgi:hypothetical protein